MQEYEAGVAEVGAGSVCPTTIAVSFVVPPRVGVPDEVREIETTGIKLATPIEAEGDVTLL